MSGGPEILRYAAFTDVPDGGNPAGIVLDASGLDDAAMQRIAAEVDYAETAFITERTDGELTVRYFSPIAEVPFCGHATVATAIAIAEREGPGALRFATPVGEIVIETAAADDGIRAAFTSVEPDVAHFPEFVLDALLELIGVDRTQLDERYPPRLASAGNQHPIVVITDSRVFDGFVFDPGAVRAFMDAQGWPATITVLHRIMDAPGGVLAVRGAQPLPGRAHHRGSRDRLGGGRGRRLPPRARCGDAASAGDHRAGPPRGAPRRADRRRSRARRHRRERASCAHPLSPRRAPLSPRCAAEPAPVRAEPAPVPAEPARYPLSPRRCAGWPG